MYFFTADEHYGHNNIIKYCNRPFQNVEEMDEAITNNHNKIVSKCDTTIHLGDFTLEKYEVAQRYIKQLNGSHVFIRGSHDYWMNKNYHEIWEKTVSGCKIIGCHYAMRTWAASHYNSWHIYGHSHGCLHPEGKSWDVGVDNNEFYPVSFDNLKEIMNNRPDNFNLIKK